MIFLITAGPTIEAIDPVRYLSNHSSGKMGYALAASALKKKHQVILVTGPTHIAPPKRAVVYQVKTALEMYKTVLKLAPKADVIIKSAAVADYRPVKVASLKIKKKNKNLILKLVKNPDILLALGKKKKKNQILVGFSAETDHVMQNGLDKMKRKNCDWMVVNNVAKKDIGFNSDLNEATLFSKAGQKILFRKTSKKQLASLLINTILR
jgi:phosphopantothenoylcysteine decarboxylase / phosphopantothenate---cysteine ligase